MVSNYDNRCYELSMGGNESNVACLNIKSCFWSIYSTTVQEKKFDDQNYGAIVMRPIRPINFLFPEFQAARRVKPPTPAVAGYSSVPLTGVSVAAGCPLRSHA